MPDCETRGKRTTASGIAESTFPPQTIVSVRGHAETPGGRRRRLQLGIELLAVHEDELHLGLRVRKVALHDHQVGDLSRLYRPHLPLDAEYLRGIDRQSFQRRFAGQALLDGASQ